MDQNHAKFLEQLNAGRLGKIILDLDAQHKLWSEGMYWQAEPVIEGIGSAGHELRDEEYDPLVIALGLVLRAKAMMMETEPRHKCELFAEALKLEAEHFKESIPLYFTNDMVQEVSLETAKDD